MTCHALVLSVFSLSNKLSVVTHFTNPYLQRMNVSHEFLARSRAQNICFPNAPPNVIPISIRRIKPLAINPAT